MKDLSYYEMRAHLYPCEEAQKVTFKLSDLEQIWYCTTKNVKRKLKKYEQEGFCLYRPGKGRGNYSKLEFCQSFQAEIEQAVTTFIEREAMDELMQLLYLPIPKSWISALSDEVQTLFGMQSSQQQKEVLRTIVRGRVTTLDPLYTSVAFESFLIHQLGDTLITYDHEHDRLLPHLAHHWIVDGEQRRWTFYLRKGVRFHHQRVMTSEDVRHTFARYRSANSPFSWLLSDVQRIDCPSPNVVTFELKRPNAFFPRFLCCDNLAILPADVPFDEHQWIGTGPFRLKERSEQKLVLEAFDPYFLERPFLYEVQFWHVPKQNISATFQISGKEVDKDLQERELIEKGFRYVAFNFRKSSIVRDQKFREALFHLADVQAMHRDLGRGRCIEASSYFPEKSHSHPRDGKRVSGLLRDSAYSGETLKLFSLDFPRAVEEAKWYVAKAEEAGIHLEHRTFSIESLYDDTIDIEADVLMMGEVASNDAHFSFMNAFYNDRITFRRFFNDEQLNWIYAKLETFRTAGTKEERDRSIDEIERYINEYRLVLFQYHPIKRRAFHHTIRNIRFESFGNVELRKLWVQ
ncbi:MAG TPA: ABC transporter substrate-binding protein [Bacillales bacterium]|nr:ABC transporter substrate-binding protein [Bacillales bacterium]